MNSLSAMPEGRADDAEGRCVAGIAVCRSAAATERGSSGTRRATDLSGSTDAFLVLDWGAGASGVSARLVTVPLIEKSRSWAGPIAPSEDGAGGGAIVVGGEAGSTAASWACAGTAKLTASANAAELMRKPTFILTRLIWLESLASVAATARLCRSIAHTSSTAIMNGRRPAAKNRRIAMFSGRRQGPARRPLPP